MKHYFTFLVSLLLVFFVERTVAQPITQPVQTADYDQTEPEIALSPLNANTIMAGWIDWQTDPERIGYGFSSNGGSTWSVSTISDLPTGWITPHDPSCAFDRHGNAFICYLPKINGVLNTVVSRTKTFQAPTSWLTHQQVDTGPLTGHDYPYIAVDNTGVSGKDGTVYVTWGHGSDVMFAYSTDTANTFTIRSSPINVGLAKRPRCTVARNGDVYVVWSDYFHVVFTKSSDRGENWTPQYTFGTVYNATGENGAGPQMYVAVDPNNENNVYCVFSDYKNPTDLTIDSSRIKFTRSTDGGNNWEPIKWVDSLGRGGQLRPAVTASPDGRIYVSYLANPASDTQYVYFVTSLDGGVHWQSPQLATNQAHNPTHLLCPSDDYRGTASAFGELHLIWTDFRNSNNNNCPNRNSDIYASAYYFTPAGPSLSSPANCATVSTSPLLSWSAAFGTTYRLQVSTSSNFASPTIDMSGITTAYYTVTGLANTTTYYWRVNASNGTTTSEWSSTWSFSTSPPPTPQLTGTQWKGWVNGVLTAYPVLTWTSSGCDVTYKLYRRYCDPYDCSDRSYTLLRYSGTALSYTDNSINLIRDGEGLVSYNYYVVAVANVDQSASPSSNEVQYTAANWIAKIIRGNENPNENIQNPVTYILHQNLPNPFNPATWIHYELPEDGHVTLKVYNPLGQEVAILVNEMQVAGYKSAQFDASNLPSGIYFYRLQVHKFVDVKKMLLIR